MSLYLLFAFFESRSLRLRQISQLRIVPRKSLLIEFDGIQQILILLLGLYDLLNTTVFLAHGTEPPVVAYHFGIAQSHSQVFETGLYCF